MLVQKNKLLISEFKKRIAKYSDIIYNLLPPKNIKKYIYEQSDHLEKGYGEKFVAYIHITDHFYEKQQRYWYKKTIISYYEKYKKISDRWDYNPHCELLVTTKDNKYIYCYRGVWFSPPNISSFFGNYLINYIFGYTDIDPEYEYGEYHNLTNKQKNELKKQQDENNKWMQKYLKNMPNYEELNEKYKNMKIKIGKLKVIPNENGKK